MRRAHNYWEVVFEGEKTGTENRHEKTGCNQHLQYANDIYHIIQRWRS